MRSFAETILFLRITAGYGLQDIMENRMKTDGSGQEESDRCRSESGEWIRFFFDNKAAVSAPVKSGNLERLVGEVLFDIHQILQGAALIRLHVA